MSQTFDVIIAGAGPVGLFLACELAIAHVSVLVREREPSPESPWKNGPLGLRGLHSPSIEAFYRRGLLHKIFSDGKRPTVFAKSVGFQPAGHFAGIMLDVNKVDFSRWDYHIPGPSLQPGPTNLGHVESVLADRAQELGVQIFRGAGFSQSSE